jgi:hypothetical protein
VQDKGFGLNDRRPGFASPTTVGNASAIELFVAPN